MTKNQRILAKIGGGSLVLLLSFSLGQRASAAEQQLVENLGQETIDIGTLDFGTWQGGSFTTGGNGFGYKLNSVTLLLLENTPGKLFARLYSDKGGTIGNPITSFNVPTIVEDLNENTFTLNSPLTLTPNTTYWVVSGVSSGTGDYSWGYTDSYNQDGLPGWTMGNGYVYSNNQGVAWTVDAPASPYQFGVNGTETPPPPINIPEPSSVVALLGLGGLGLVSSRKKRK